MPALINTDLDTPASVAAALAMARRFGIDRVVALSQFESYGNENWLLEAPEGRSVVLRRYVHTSRDRVRFQHQLLRHLRDAGFPAPQVLTSRAGADFEEDDHGIAWAMFAHIEGREYDFSTGDAVQAARRLAELHVLGRDLALEAPPLQHRPSILQCWANAEADVAGLRDLFAGKGLDEELAYLDTWWRNVLAEWPLERLEALPAGLVHGDLHGRNTAYVDGQLAGIFDFDDVEVGPLAHDLAWSTYKFARESRFSPGVRADVAHAFIQAYDSVRPLTAEERAALPVLLAMTYPPNPAYYRYYRDHHGTNLENRLRRETGLMRFLRDEVARVFP